MSDHRDADPVDLVRALYPLDNFFQRIEGPVHSDEGFSSRTLSPRFRKPAEMAFSQTALLIVKEEIQSFKLGIPVETPFLEA
jgi:hypothetical protein